MSLKLPELSLTGWLLAGAAALGTVGAVASIGLLAADLLSDDETAVEDLEVAETPAAPEPSQPTEVIVAAGEEGAVAPLVDVEEGRWLAEAKYMNVYLPASLDLSTFPFSGPGDDLYSCTPDQIAWLDAHGAANFGHYDTPVLVLTNGADAGGALALTNIRFDATVETEDPLVQVYCGIPLGIGDAIPQKVVLHLDGSAGTYGAPGPQDPDTIQPEGQIATVNVAPGQAQVLVLETWEVIDELGPGRYAVGSVLADVVSPDTSEEVLVEELVLHGPPVLYEAFILADQPYACDGNVWDDVPCTVAEANAVLRSAMAD